MDAICHLGAPTDNRAEKISDKARSSCRAGSQVTTSPCPCSQIPQCYSLRESASEKRHCPGGGCREDCESKGGTGALPPSLCPQEVLHKALGHEFTLVTVWSGKTHGRNFLLKRHQQKQMEFLFAKLKPILTPQKPQSDTSFKKGVNLLESLPM